MKTRTFLAKDGETLEQAGNPDATPAVPAVSYEGYIADDAQTLDRHVVDADDAELDQRVVVRPRQIVDTITTSDALATYHKLSVGPTQAHIDVATTVEAAAGKPGMESFIPTFDDLTDSQVATPTDTKKQRRLLTDQEIHDGIMRATRGGGGTNYAKKAAARTTPSNGTSAATSYKTDMVSPSNQYVPVEPMGVDIVTDTRAVDLSTGAITKGQQLAIRYRFTRSDGVDDGTAADYNQDAALVDGSGNVLEEYRGTAAYNAGTDAPAVDTAIAPATGTDNRAHIDVDVTMDGASVAQATVTSADNTLTYSKYGLWSYNNTRGCSTCPEDGLRGATAFGLKAKAADVSNQTHVGIWRGQAAAFWAPAKSVTNNAIAINTDEDPDVLRLTAVTGVAEVGVNFLNNKVQANMDMSEWYEFRFHGTLDADKLGYTATLDTRPGSSGKAGAIWNGDGGAGDDSYSDLAEDSNGNVHATGALSGAFYGPP